MTMQIPPIFKPMTPFIRRAEELDRDITRGETKLVAHYCRQFAMEMGIQLRADDASEESTQFLLSLMDSLEQEKKTMPPFTLDEVKRICEDFAFEVFQRADDEDRAGNANKNTARTFYAAGTFFDILRQFGELEIDIQEKIKYCKFKAADILKAIKEGRTPKPGAPGEEVESKIEAAPPAPEAPAFPATPIDDFPNMSAATVPPSTNFEMPPEAPTHEPVMPSPPIAPAYAPPPPLTSQPISQSRRAGTRSQMEIDDAIECCKFAVAALKTKEVDLAIDRLEKALQCIR